MKYFYFLVLVIHFHSAGTSQTNILNGTWTGNYAKTLLSFNPKVLMVELSIHNDSIISGASHLYYSSGRFEHHKLDGKLNLKDSSIVFKESLVETDLPTGAYDVLYHVKLISYANKWRLEGKWKGVNGFLGFLPYNTVWLEKPKDSLQLTQTNSLNTSTISTPLQAEASLKRITDIQKIIEVSSSEKDSIQISLYDNGEIDNDSVSIYLNDQLLLQNEMLSANPKTFYISLDKNIQFQKIKMIAENLGGIPPNTALMIISTKQKRYEVRMKSDLDKNAVVEFVLME